METQKTSGKQCTSANLPINLPVNLSQILRQGMDENLQTNIRFEMGKQILMVKRKHVLFKGSHIPLLCLMTGEYIVKLGGGFKYVYFYSIWGRFPF